MNAILQAISETPSLATLPRAAEEGRLPALITQLSGSMRAVCAAMLTLYFARFCKPGAVRSLLVCLGGAGTVGLYTW